MRKRTTIKYHCAQCQSTDLSVIETFEEVEVNKTMAQLQSDIQSGSGPAIVTHEAGSTSGSSLKILCNACGHFINFSN